VNFDDEEPQREPIRIGFLPAAVAGAVALAIIFVVVPLWSEHLSDAERAWCSGHEVQLEIAYGVTAGRSLSGDLEDRRFVSELRAYLTGTPSAADLELTRDEKDAVARACRAAYEGR
jgi:hypothetical protein